MSTGAVTPGNPTFGSVHAHRRRPNDVTAAIDADAVHTTGQHQHQQQEKQSYHYQPYNVNENINECITEAAVDCFGKGLLEKRYYGKLGWNMRSMLLGFLIIFLGFSVFVRITYPGGVGLPEMEDEVNRSSLNAKMLILRDYKSHVMMNAHRVLEADVDYVSSSSLPKRILEKSLDDNNHVSLIYTFKFLITITKITV